MRTEHILKEYARLCSPVVTLVLLFMVTMKRMKFLTDLRATYNQLINRLFKNRERSFNYVHSKHQKEMINIMAGQVKTDIVQRMHEARIFALIADETQDISRHEQVAVI